VSDAGSRAASHAQWSTAAQAWARDAERREAGPAGRAADWMLSAAALEPGQRVLELACGAGDVSLRAAQLVGPGGHVVASDFAEPMVEVVRGRAAAAGLDQVHARVLDAEDPQLEGERFDAVLCRFGYMLMAQPGRAVRASFDALAPGGRIALAVWGAAERNPWMSLVTDATMSTLGAPPPAPGTPGPFALAEHARLRELLTGAGFDDVSVEELEDERRYASLDEWWEGMLEPDGPMGALLGHLDEHQRESIRADAIENALPYDAGADGVRFPVAIAVAAGARERT
jgi:ubiquinone/menaquinone biosynthesis C-methylase UbiE